MTAPTTTGAAQRYLADVEAELADLPAEERAELLDDLAMHLVAVEQEQDDRPLAARLGSSADYAAELRAAAGLPPRATAVTAPRRGWTTTVRIRGTQLAGQRWARELRAFVPSLRPAWWVLRGYLVVLLPSLSGIDGTRDFPLPAPLGSHLLGAAAVLAAVVASVALGRRRLPRLATAAVIVVNVALVVTAMQVAQTATSRLSSYRFTAIVEPALVSPEAFPLTSVHGPVTNIYPYAADGKPLAGVLLYDQDGRPLRSSRQQWWADGCRRVLAPPLAADGVAVPFSYPHAYRTDPAQAAVDPQVRCAAAVTVPTVPLPRFAPTAPKQTQPKQAQK